jgi:apolipoprotein D and lipocalin family protein
MHPVRLPSRTRLALVAGMLCCLGAGHRHAALPTVPCVDLARFAGRWHEIARLPNCFQRGCVGAQAVYTPRRDGTLGVVNTCTTARGRCRQVEGWAEPVPCSGNARLRVRFGGLAALAPVPREGNYWIIALDDDYRHALVGTPDRRFLWILSREACVDPEVYREFTARARCLGFDVDRLVTCGR